MNKKTFQVLSLLSESVPPYEAVTWLGAPNPELDGKTPYEMIKRNRIERVRAVAERYIKEVRLKKKRRSCK